MGVKQAALAVPCYYTDPRRCVGFFCLQFTKTRRVVIHDDFSLAAGCVFPVAMNGDPTVQKPQNAKKPNHLWHERFTIFLWKIYFTQP